MNDKQLKKLLTIEMHKKVKAFVSGKVASVEIVGSCILQIQKQLELEKSYKHIDFDSNGFQHDFRLTFSLKNRPNCFLTGSSFYANVITLWAETS